MTDIARQARVSKNTVSLALRHDPQIPAGTRRRIAQIARKLGYQKNPTVAHLMAQLRVSRSPASQPLLALVNANLDREAFLRHPTIPVYVEGCRRRAHELGYLLDEFWLHEPELNGGRFNKIIRARNIRGLVIVGLMNENRLPARFLPTWQSHPCVVTGVRTRDPALSFACTDHHILTIKAFEQALHLGYKRPALVLDKEIDQLVDGRFTAGMLIAQQQIPASRRATPFYFVNQAKRNPDLFHRWFAKEKPDLILTLYHNVQEWLREAGYKSGKEIGLIQLDRRHGRPEWSGMDQHSDIIGASAVEMLIGMIHNNESGIPSYPRATLIGSTWVEGKTTLKSAPF